ncbi:Smr/MutS family protein [Aridibaculum aurantiacum]|uniref:Smr/MutS family protein n=1 Tax=Aridibaculum aurantiacum TaxID=2810307 RepID=UPI001A965047|nr:Smr/MutS family protein [Aridibaculum aurantiacum]
MKYQVGDEIIVVHSNDEGKVIEIINDKMVLIEVKGVKFPAYMDQIDFPYFKRFTQKKLFPEQKKPKVYVDQVQKEKRRDEVKVEDGIWVALFPKFDTDIFGDDVVDIFKVYLINRTEEGYDFNYKYTFAGGHVDFEITSEIQGFKDFYLHDISFESLNDNPSFDFEFSLLQPSRYKAEFVEAHYKIKPKQLFKKIEELKEKNLPSLTHKLLDRYPDKAYEDSGLDLNRLQAAGFKIYDAKKVKQHLEPARSVVDLHIEKFVDSWKHLSNFEIITLQLKEFEKWYDLAVAHRLPSFIVIHGVGKGKLKEEIHDILKTKKDVKTFVNQYDARFGYGATEIFFQY